MQGLEVALRAFGGGPREVLFDQMRSVLLRDLRPEGGRLIPLGRPLEFPAPGLLPLPGEDEEKVERPIRYLRQRFFYGRAFLSDADLQARGHRVGPRNLSVPRAGYDRTVGVRLRNRTHLAGAIFRPEALRVRSPTAQK